MKQIPKSLHTVTVFVRVAAYFVADGATPEQAVWLTVDLLGYNAASDPYDLVAAAIKQLHEKVTKPIAAGSA